MLARVVGVARSRWRGGSFGRNVLTLVIGTGMSQVIVVATAPVLTRLYAPADFGLFSVANSIMAILMSITCLRLEFAVPLPQDDVEAANVLGLTLLLAALLSVVSVVVLWLVGDRLLILLGGSALGAPILLIAVGQFGGGVVSSLGNWAVRTKDFASIASMRMSQAIALVVVQTGLGIAGIGATGLLAGAVLSRFAGASRLARSAWRTHASEFRQVSRAGMRRVASRYRSIALLSTPSAILNTVGLQAPTLLLVLLYGVDTGGLYALAQRITSIPLTLIASAVGQVFLAEAARDARSDARAVRTLFLRTTVSLARLGIAPTILLMIAAPLVAGPVFGGAWNQVGLYIAILAPMYLITFVTTATGDGLYAVERMDLQLIREIVRLVCLGGSVPLAAALGFDATGAVMMLSVGGAVAYLGYGVIMWWAINRHAARFGRSPDAEQTIADV